VQSAFRGHKARSAMRSGGVPRDRGRSPRRESWSPPPGDGESLPAAESSERGDGKPPLGDEKPPLGDEKSLPRDARGGLARTTPGKKKKSPGGASRGGTRGKARGGERTPENDGGFGFGFECSNENEKARKAATPSRGSSAGKPRATRPGGGPGARGRGTTEDDEGGSPGRVLDRFLNHNPYGVAKRLLREAREAPGEAPASPPSRAPFSPPPWKPASYTIFDSPSAHPPPDF